jgi:predicted ATPase
MTSQDDTDRFIVLTGGPGAGKSAVIDALARADHAHSREAGRAVIQDQVARGGRALPWIDPTAFAELMLEFELRSYGEAQSQRGLVFFDRGMPDIVGYLRLSGLPVPPHVDNAARTYRYNRRVFILPPWREIFRQDSERKQDFGEAVRTYEMMVRAYGNYGYELVEVPHASIEERLGLILQTLAPHP